jgi:hypothetical protein
MALTGTSLNPSDVASGAGISAPILSNGNLTVQAPGSSNNYVAIRSVAGAAFGSSGYFEVTVNQQGSNNNGSAQIGFCESTASLDQDGASVGSFQWGNNGATGVNGSSGPTIGAWTSGNPVLGIAFSGSLIWCRVGPYGLWNNNWQANPATGQGGISLAGLSGTMMAMFWSNNFGGTATVVTFNFSFPASLPPSAPLTCQAWARIIPAGVSFIQQWSNGGNPEKLRGGFPFTGPSLPGSPVYLTAQGTGDAIISVNTAPAPQNAPKGFYPGWPSGKNSGGYAIPGDTLNASTAQGSAVGNVIANQVSFPTLNGLVQGTTGVLTGRYYFEYTLTGYDVFSSQSGVGVGRLGPSLAAWFNKGGYSTNDPNGGLFIDGGTPSAFNANLDGNTIQGPAIVGSASQGVVVGVAVMITQDFTPFIYQEQLLQPTPLVCVPCKELLIGPSGFGGFGT